MKIDTKSRLPLFELSIIIGLALIGYTGWELYKSGPKLDREQRRLAEYELQSSNLQQVLDNLASTFSNEVAELHRSPLKAIDLRHEALNAKSEYSSIAQHVSSGINELQTLLPAAMRPKGAVGDAAERFQRKLGDFGEWMKKEKERTEGDHLRAASSELKKELEQARLASSNGPASIRMDLGTLVEALERTFANYSTNAVYLLNNADRPMIKESLAQHSANAEQAAGQLAAYAQQANADAGALKLFLDSQAESAASERERKQERAIEAFLNARQRIEDSRPGVAAPAAPSLTPALIAVLLAMAALSAFLMVAIYRRVVVVPLRFSLVEREAKSKLDRFEQLAAGLAHEIKQPLTAISARLFTLQKGLQKEMDEYKDSAVIKTEIHRLNPITNDFLKLARPAEPRMLPLEAKPILGEVKDLLAPNCAEKSIRLVCDGIDGGRFRADPQQLKQVLMNLVHNAAESIGHDGVITLRAHQGTSRLNSKPTQVVMLEVEDNGPGIPTDVQDRLFDPFYSTKEQGTGLGLPIARRIIEKHGGDLQFESEPGQGALFRIVLPLYREESDHG